MAEALAKKIVRDNDVEFMSAGSHPTKHIDPGVLKILKEEGIEWTGKPKSFRDIGRPDIVVTMGCDVECPFIPGARTISWDLKDPKGKSMEAYRFVRSGIDRLLSQLMEEIHHLCNSGD
jgi:arsenate reductase